LTLPTLDYSVVLPMTITVAISYGLRKLLSGESIYTKKLARRGHIIPDSLRASLIHVKCAGDIMETRFAFVEVNLASAALQDTLKDESMTNLLAVDGDRIIGLLSRDAALSLLNQGGDTNAVRDAARMDFLAVTEQISILGLISRIFSHELSYVLVLSAGTTPTTANILGVITKKRLAEVVAEAVEPFS
jgi:chloride channel protein, CIC family